jgi:hypothetical protein
VDPVDPDPQHCYPGVKKATDPRSGSATLLYTREEKETKKVLCSGSGFGFIMDFL